MTPAKETPEQKRDRIRRARLWYEMQAQIADAEKRAGTLVPVTPPQQGRAS